VKLSIAIITADPPERVATILESLRPHADEIVIAADSRVDERTLSGYRSLTDRLFRIDFRWSERHLGWLCAQCNGDWIMRLDGDEVPSAAFLRRLPELLESRQLRQVWTQVAWVYADGDQVLAQAPWNENFTVRLLRNDGTVRARGLQHFHFEPVAPREYLEEPFYHLDLVVGDQQTRRDKAIRYEVARPGLIAPGGGRINEAYYLPELRDSLALRPVPEEDRELVVAVLRASRRPAPASAAVADVRLVGPNELDRFWEGRAVDANACQATIVPHEPSCVMTPSEHREVFFRVRNEGSERWPGGWDERPHIRVAYRWLFVDGHVHTGEGLRSAFPRPVAPGEQVLMPVDLAAPAEVGNYLLELDVVHEHVRWFDCACRLPVTVRSPASLPPVGARLHATPPRKLSRWRALRIPRTIHRVWLGESQIPLECERLAATFVEHHPNWETRLWTDIDLDALAISDEDRARAHTLAGLSHLVRYEVLHRFGGIYVDNDVECLQPISPLLMGVDAFVALAGPGIVGTAVLGSVPDHPVFARAAQLARPTLGSGPHHTDANGSYLLSLIVEQEPSITIFDSSLFYPRERADPDRRHDTLSDAYTTSPGTLCATTRADDTSSAQSGRG
jgi:inositol phosphorylceramide mannosyltransferase catalytic subunit